MEIKKFSGNPILTPRESDWEGLQVRNPAAWYDGIKVYMVYSARTKMNNIFLGLAESEDGFNFIRVSDRPFYAPKENAFDGGTIEDARMVKFDDTYYISYVARAVGKEDFLRGKRSMAATSDGITWSTNARRGGILKTKDFKRVECLGPITSEYNYDCNIILFPEKINGKYVLLHRPSLYNQEIENTMIPMDVEKPGINLAFSEDLVNWHYDQCIALPEQPWESAKIGGSTPPIKTQEGWLTLYHGVQDTEEGRIYRVGVMLLDLEDPTKVIARCPHFIMEPEADFEKVGTVNNVVFPNGNVVIDDNLYIYYGGADTVCCVATVKLKEIIQHVMKYKR
jgi:beta-1,2-mannobiose phosphorylase / 1,2-beta-oligomannan phosphorylase